MAPERMEDSRESQHTRDGPRALEPPSELLLDALLGAADVLLLVLDTDGRVALANRGCELAIGRPFEELRGRLVWDAFAAHPERARLRQWLAELLAEGYPRCDEGRWRTRDGRLRLVRWSSSVVLDASGRPAWVVCSGSDITEERRARIELSEREARLRAVLETAVDGIVVIDEQGRIESVNAAAERIFDYRPGELIGRRVGTLMPEDHAARHDQYVERYLHTGEARIIGIGREVEARRHDGSLFPAELAVSEIHLPGRRSFVGMVRDISQRRAAEERARLRLHELAHTARLLELGEMTSGIAHEVNQPLTAIVSFAEASVRMLDAAQPELGLVRDALEQIAGQGRRAAEIIQRLRRFVRKGATERRVLDIGPLLADVLGLLAHDIRHRGVRVEVELAEALPPVLADRVQIEQVAVNLVRNACEAMRETPVDERVLTLRTRIAAAEVEVEVIDHGPGLPEHIAQQLFRPFFTTKAEGMGVGLAISRSIIEAHGGKLWAENHAGAGAAFRFTLPLAHGSPDDGC